MLSQEENEILSRVGPGPSLPTSPVREAVLAVEED
jgi:hypothetical protein